MMKYLYTEQTNLRYPNVMNCPITIQKGMDYNKETKVWTIYQYNRPVKGSNVCTITVSEYCETD